MQALEFFSEFAESGLHFDQLLETVETRSMRQESDGLSRLAFHSEGSSNSCIAAPAKPITSMPFAPISSIAFASRNNEWTRFFCNNVFHYYE